MGTVHLGVRDDDELPAPVALKVIQAGSSTALLDRFRRERRILAGLIRPYIAGLPRCRQAGRRPALLRDGVRGWKDH